MQKLTIDIDKVEIILQLVKQGITFEAQQTTRDTIEIIFTGGY